MKKGYRNRNGPQNPFFFTDVEPHSIRFPLSSLPFPSSPWEARKYLPRAHLLTREVPFSLPLPAIMPARLHDQQFSASTPRGKLSLFPPSLSDVFFPRLPHGSPAGDTYTVEPLPPVVGPNTSFPATPFSPPARKVATFFPSPPFIFFSLFSFSLER